MKRALMRIKKTLYAFLGILIIVILLFTIPPKNAVRATMLIHGASPVSAFRCNPKYDSGNSRELKMDLYTIPNKYGYIDDTGVRNTCSGSKRICYFPMVRQFLGVTISLVRTYFECLGHFSVHGSTI